MRKISTILSQILLALVIPAATFAVDNPIGLLESVAHDKIRVQATYQNRMPDYYRVERCQGEIVGEPQSTVGIQIGGRGTFTHLDSNLTANTLYTYRITALVGDYNAPEIMGSTVLSATTQEAKTPGAPTDLTAIVLNSGVLVQLNWVDRSNYEDGFIIYRQAIGASEVEEVARVGANQTTYQETVAPAYEYSYSVRAFRKVGDTDVVSNETLPARLGNSLRAKILSFQ